MDQDTAKKISRIIELELEITRAIYQGHKPSADDQYQQSREELKRLREELKIPNHQEQKYRK